MTNPRRSTKRAVLAVILVAFLFSALSAASAQPLPKIELELVGSGFNEPVHIVGQPGLPERLLVTEQAGRVYSLDHGVKGLEPFLDLSAVVDSGGEKGLLSIAFHPQFKRNGKIYVNYTKSDPELRTVVAELKLDPTTGRIDTKTERQILAVNQPYSNHNGGQIAFGPDGMLFIGMGDGGSRMDPRGHGQNTDSLLGDILRIDVDGGDPYGVPMDNPFSEGRGGKPEIWAFGFRNPWRFSFDRKTGELWVGDVGQDHFEEIDIVRRGGNFGWNVYEGSRCLRIQIDCKRHGFEMPVVEYGHDVGQSVTGGFVYRGEKFPELQGVYLYADYVTGRIWGVRYAGGKVQQPSLLLDTSHRISSFGESTNGELYLASHNKGEIYQIVMPAPPAETDDTANASSSSASSPLE